MTFTVAEARNQKNANMHCGKGHKFSLQNAYKDQWGTWCPECGNGAHSYNAESCPLCQECNECSKPRGLDHGKCADCWRKNKR